MIFWCLALTTNIGLPRQTKRLHVRLKRGTELPAFQYRLVDHFYVYTETQQMPRRQVRAVVGRPAFCGRCHLPGLCV